MVDTIYQVLILIVNSAYGYKRGFSTLATGERAYSSQNKTFYRELLVLLYLLVGALEYIDRNLSKILKKNTPFIEAIVPITQADAAYAQIRCTIYPANNPNDQSSLCSLFEEFLKHTLRHLPPLINNPFRLPPHFFVTT